MAESFLIALREGFEASLIVAIVLAFVKRRSPEHTRTVWLGTGAALGLSLVAGVVLQYALDGLEGQAKARTFAFTFLAAGGLLTWMIFWMRTHARNLRAELEGKAGAAIASGSSTALAMVAFTAVLREGLETALFLISAAESASAVETLSGIGLGLAAATVLGIGVYHGTRRFNMRLFFNVTGFMIIVFAAGLVSKFFLFAQGQADLFGSANLNGVFDARGVRWLDPGASKVGEFLQGFFGWDPRPSIEQVVAYLAYLVPVTWLYFRGGKPVAVPKASTPSKVAAPA